MNRDMKFGIFPKKNETYKNYSVDYKVLRFVCYFMILLDKSYFSNFAISALF